MNLILQYNTTITTITLIVLSVSILNKTPLFMRLLYWECRSMSPAVLTLRNKRYLVTHIHPKKWRIVSVRWWQPPKYHWISFKHNFSMLSQDKFQFFLCFYFLSLREKKLALFIWIHSWWCEKIATHDTFFLNKYRKKHNTLT